MSSSTLYERIGGKDALDAAVDLFYGKVLADDRINFWFESVDMAKQRGKQKAFLAYAFGAPIKYTGEDMRSAHAPMVEKGLNDDHFNAVAENLVATLVDLNVPQELIDEVCTLLETTRGDVLGN